MLQAGNHSAGSGCPEDRALSHESILHVDDNQGAAARVDGEKAFLCSAGVGRHGLSLPFMFSIDPEHMSLPGLPMISLYLSCEAIGCLFLCLHYLSLD